MDKRKRFISLLREFNRNPWEKRWWWWWRWTGFIMPLLNRKQLFGICYSTQNGCNKGDFRSLFAKSSIFQTLSISMESVLDSERLQGIPNNISIQIFCIHLLRFFVFYLNEVLTRYFDGKIEESMIINRSVHVRFQHKISLYQEAHFHKMYHYISLYQEAHFQRKHTHTLFRFS